MLERFKKKVVFIQHRMGDGGVTYSLANLLVFLTNQWNLDITLVLRYRDNSPRMDLIPKRVKQIWYDECSDGFFQKHYDVVIAYMPDMGEVLDRFLHVENRILWIHGDYSAFPEEVRNSLIPCIKKANSIITPSKKASESIAKIDPSSISKIFTIRHTMQDSLIQKRAKEEISDWPDFNTLTVVTVGKLFLNAKGVDRMIKVHRSLLDDGLDFRWLMVGFGPDHEWLEGLISEYQLTGKFIILGFRKNPYPYIHKADIFALFSYHEGYSLALSEAKILRKPIIVTNFAGAEDQINHMVNGMIVGNNELDIREGLIRILTDEPLREKFVKNLEQYRSPNQEIIRQVENVFWGKARA